MAIPSFVLAASWIPFVVILVLILLFSIGYVRYYMSKYDSEVSSTLAAIFALAVGLFTTALIPVDIFLVSYMKDSDGEFKDWANDSTVRTEIEHSVLYAYLTLYGLVSFCIFILLPFMYFFYEEKDEDSTCKSRCCTALKYLCVFIIFAAVLFCIGAFVPTKTLPNKNDTEWKQIEALIEEMGSNGGEDAISFTISVLSLIGMLLLILYTAYGMSSLPIGLIVGRLNVKKERLEVQSQITDTEGQIDSIKQRHVGRKKMSKKDERRVEKLQESDHLMERRLRHLIEKENSCVNKCMKVLRPFEMIFGILFGLLAVLIYFSLLLSNIDKAVHSKGYSIGYALPQRTLPNPIDIALVYSQKVFPLDYILMSCIVVYFVFCSMSGIRNIGIWFFCVKMYKIRVRRTKPQGLLMLCMILMFIILAINIILYELTPQYSSFGSQHYKLNSTNEIKACTTAVSSDNCTVTQMVTLLTSFFYKMNFFGAAYYFGTWAFLGVYLIGLIIAIIRGRKSAISTEVEDSDFEESDEELLTG
ncbi:hypothetical protein LOTGIDRAFT_235253 [Lottia gigantea]|uniref:Lysosomal cobalamin transporter n=1 Tax=Lottia gigantea TaxID=225164 RepID=V4A048_LOTGI|nr:hypothetical protein LOTGIDRAFT_235253 [Lottia gigantea]ESO86626.1 hypothetical protein LOTGIDRAFT_235253 [Lottia gigantea]